MILNMMDDLQKISDDFRTWVTNNNGPALMIAIIIIGLLVFSITYGMLHKND